MVFSQSDPGVSVWFDQPHVKGCVVFPQLPSALMACAGLLDVVEDDPQLLLGLYMLHLTGSPDELLTMLLLLLLYGDCFPQ